MCEERAQIHGLTGGRRWRRGRRGGAPFLLLLLLVMALRGTAHAEPFIPDDVSRAIYAAAIALNEGSPREVVLRSYQLALANAAPNSYRAPGEAYLRDLEESVRREAELRDSADPVSRLMDSRWWPLVWRPENEERDRFNDWLRKQDQPASPRRGPRTSHDEWFPAGSDDPALAILKSDRSVIERLIPLLEDRSPTRVRPPVHGMVYPHIPRVCDLAISLIQYHGRVWFFDQFAFRELLHEREQIHGRGRIRDRRAIVTAVRTWWSQAKGHSVSDGIRLLLPAAGFYEKASMAENLIALGRETGDSSLEVEGRNLLLDMFQSTRHGSLSAYVARTLERYDDTSVVEEVYRRLAAAREKPGYLIDFELVDYLIKHAGRREWELLTELAKEGYAAPRADGSWSPVGPAIVSSGASRTQLWAVPALALALDRTEVTGSRAVAGSAAAQSFSLADVAIEHLQAVTGTDFGYRPSDTSEERGAAIARAQQWWKDEGQARYTFDAIERMLGAHGEDAGR